jgi:hypothetical protein
VAGERREGVRVSGVNGVSFLCLSVCLCVCLSLCEDVADMCSAACFPSHPVLPQNLMTPLLL